MRHQPVLRADALQACSLDCARPGASGFRTDRPARTGASGGTRATPAARRTRRPARRETHLVRVEILDPQRRQRDAALDDRPQQEALEFAPVCVLRGDVRNASARFAPCASDSGCGTASRTSGTSRQRTGSTPGPGAASGSTISTSTSTATPSVSARRRAGAAMLPARGPGQRRCAAPSATSCRRDCCSARPERRAWRGRRWRAAWLPAVDRMVSRRRGCRPRASHLLDQLQRHGRYARLAALRDRRLQLRHEHRRAVLQRATRSSRNVRSRRSTSSDSSVSASKCSRAIGRRFTREHRALPRVWRAMRVLISRGAPP